jgi:hypothetical protein
VRIGGASRVFRITDEGHRFAGWLISKGRKCSFFWTPQGEWGTPEPGSAQEKLLSDAKAELKKFTMTNQSSG